MRLVLLGAPGAGKGTQAKRIAKNFGIMHISTGDILRDELKRNTELGKKANNYMQKGELVPDELIIEMIKNIITDNKNNINNNNIINKNNLNNINNLNNLKEADKKDRKNLGFIMDGFPRTLNQAEKFDEMLNSLNLKLDKVINIYVDKNELIKRLSSRRICHSCNNICSINEKQNRGLILQGKCPVCGGDLYQRKDDDIEVIKQRLDVYERQTKPLIDYYQKKNLLVNIDGMGSEEDITERILANL